MAAQPGHERLDGGEDLLIVAQPRITVNSGQSGELTVRDLVLQVAAAAPPRAIPPCSGR
jgi:hypothetical protein